MLTILFTKATTLPCGHTQVKSFELEIDGNRTMIRTAITSHGITTIREEGRTTERIRIVDIEIVNTTVEIVKATIGYDFLEIEAMRMTTTRIELDPMTFEEIFDENAMADIAARASDKKVPLEGLLERPLRDGELIGQQRHLTLVK